MHSCPEVWRDFYEAYYGNELNNLATKVEQYRNNGNANEYLTLNINFLKDLTIFKEGLLAEETIRNPDIALEHANKGLKTAHNIHDVELVEACVRLYNLPSYTKIELNKLGRNQVSNLVSVEGMVKKVTYRNQITVTAAYVCSSCAVKVYIPVEEGFLQDIPKPYECKSCGSRKFLYLPNESEMIDAQFLHIQEYPENLKGGEEPRIITVIAREDLTGAVYPGNRIVVNAIPKLRALKKGMNEIYLDANSIEAIEKEYEEIEITKDEEKEIFEVAKSENLDERIKKSIARPIKGYENIKLAIALQLFGGKPKTIQDGLQKRGDIHLLLVGNPGTAKSLFTKWTANVAPRAMYSTGHGTTGAGLTASAVKSDDGKWTLEAGTLVLADKGMALVDELDKMGDSEYGYFNEALEQQSVTVSKAGIHATLSARCSLLAAANPKYRQFDPYAPIGEQIDFDPTLLDRFDLIFIIKDKPDEVRDREIAESILNEEDYEESGDELSTEFLKKYIAYAKRSIYPTLTDEAKQRLNDYYVNVRSLSGKSEKNPIPVTARILDSLKRLSEASARMRLSKHITREDADKSIEIMSDCMKSISMNPETGEIDANYAHGTPKNTVDKIKHIRERVRSLEKMNNEQGPTKKEILDNVNIDRDHASELINKMRHNAELFGFKYIQVNEEE